MKKNSILWLAMGLAACVLTGALCIYDLTSSGLQPLWHTGVCLFVLMPIAAVCFTIADGQDDNASDIVRMQRTSRMETAA